MVKGILNVKQTRYLVLLSNQAAASRELPPSVECPICLLCYRDPRILNCGHSFCHRCIRHTATNTAAADQIELACPKCRREFRWQNVEQLDATTKNFELASLVEELESNKPELQERLCAVKRVLVFGAAKAGKTSMLNTLTDEIRDTSDSAIGCTLDMHQYEPVVRNQAAYIFYDTAGLNEAAGGKVEASVAQQKLLDFVTTTRYGFNLLVFVFRKGAITDQMIENYQLFGQVMTEGRIPVLAVVTRCEDEEPINAWIDRNRQLFAERGLHFAAMVGSCFIQPTDPVRAERKPVFDRLRLESKHSVFKAIETMVIDSEPLEIFPQDGIAVFIKRMWNRIAHALGLSAKFKFVERRLYDMYVRMGNAPNVAKDKAADFFVG